MPKKNILSKQWNLLLRNLGQGTYDGFVDAAQILDKIPLKKISEAMFKKLHKTLSLNSEHYDPQHRVSASLMANECIKKFYGHINRSKCLDVLYSLLQDEEDAVSTSSLDALTPYIMYVKDDHTLAVYQTIQRLLKSDDTVFRDIAEKALKEYQEHFDTSIIYPSEDSDALLKQCTEEYVVCGNDNLYNMFVQMPMIDLRTIPWQVIIPFAAKQLLEHYCFEFSNGLESAQITCAGEVGNFTAICCDIVHFCNVSY